MAPEVLQAKDKVGYDCKSDIWSLGITAMELAKGVPPHSDMHPMRVIFKIPYVASPKLPDPDNWSPAFMDFIAACLTKDFSLRPSAEELLKHQFITGAGPISIMAELVTRSMAEIDLFRSEQEAVEAKTEEALLTAKENDDDVDSSRSRNDTFDSANGNMYGTSLIDEFVTNSSADSYLPAPTQETARRPKREAYGTTQVDTDFQPDADSYLGDPSKRKGDAKEEPPAAASYGTTVLDSTTFERAKDSYLAQVQSAAKAKYEAEAAAAAAKEKASQEDGPLLVATIGNWQIIRDIVGRIYYNDTRTNKVTWEQPTELDGVVGLALIGGAKVRSSTNDDDDGAPSPVSVTEPEASPTALTEPEPSPTA
jgi:hypothetical protein